MFEINKKNLIKEILATLIECAKYDTYFYQYVILSNIVYIWRVQHIYQNKEYLMLLRHIEEILTKFMENTIIELIDTRFLTFKTVNINKLKFLRKLLKNEEFRTSALSHDL